MIIGMPSNLSIEMGSLENEKEICRS